MVWKKQGVYKSQLKIIVIGGGAAGFFAAITCAVSNQDNQVILLEASSQPLAKVRISGGGRCNVTHHCFEPKDLVQYYPRGGKSLLGAFTRFQPKDTVAWFEAQGVPLKTEADGRMFPVTDNSESIVNCLITKATQAGVIIRKSSPVASLIHLNSRFLVKLKSGETLESDRLMIATGSNKDGYRWAKNLGHHVESPVPSLFTFNIGDERLIELAGVSVASVNLRLLNTGKIKLEQTGPVLITHWGLSGPGVLKLSAWSARILHENNYQMKLMLNWLPQYSPESLHQHLLQVKTQTPKKFIFANCPVSLPRRLWESLVISSAIEEQKPWAEISKKQLNDLIQQLTQGVYQIQGKGIFKEEFVTCGGVSLKEVDFKTMESKLCRGLYFAGEILDIDGVTGGFNFQSAWTTGFLAGQAMAVENIV